MFNATAYNNSHPDPVYHLDNVPSRWAHRIDLEHPNGAQTVLIYEEKPSNEELRELMRQLQFNAGKEGGTVTVVKADGTRTDAPPLR